MTNSERHLITDCVSGVASDFPSLKISNDHAASSAADDNIFRGWRTRKRIGEPRQLIQQNQSTGFPARSLDSWQTTFNDYWLFKNN